ncbi:MAG: phosphate ABC transporter ATP-binding protein [Anaerolineaceae bacterium]|jgi:putative ABC transport system ATP-binding protein|nr:phosphate ABC transporter ATP-binding protein [Anaerolineaceae bacterium]
MNHIPVLEMKNLGREADGKILVADINLVVTPGEVLAITGPSGAGKTTLLRLFNRLDEPTQGTVLLDGEDYRQMAVSTLRRRVGMLLQQAYLFPGTVAENLRFGPLQQGRQLEDVVVDELLERVGLPGFAGTDVAVLSGGEAQRVSLARTLANDPCILLLDEPTSSLDEANRRGIESLILEIVHQTGMSCVMVTHDLQQAARMADRVLVLEGARMVRTGTPQEVLNA